MAHAARGRASTPSRLATPRLICSQNWSAASRCTLLFSRPHVSTSTWSVDSGPEMVERRSLSTSIVMVADIGCCEPNRSVDESIQRRSVLEMARRGLRPVLRKYSSQAASPIILSLSRAILVGVPGCAEIEDTCNVRLGLLLAQILGHQAAHILGERNSELGGLGLRAPLRLGIHGNLGACIHDGAIMPSFSGFRNASCVCGTTAPPNYLRRSDMIPG